jgi:hypothetical protein
MAGGLFESGDTFDPNSPAYVLRNADEEGLERLRRMEFLSIIAPHQQGKTSLIIRLKSILEIERFVFLFIDLGAYQFTEQGKWYCAVGEHLFERLEAEIGLPLDRAKIPCDARSWEKFYNYISELARSGGYRLVVILEDVGTIPPGWSTEFFSSIRSITSYRNFIPSLKYITFILSGAFDPWQLIKNKAVSSFNVSHRLKLQDFTLDQIAHRIEQMGADATSALEFAALIIEYTGGQPYMVQRICAFINDHPRPITTKLVESAVSWFLREDFSFIWTTFSMLIDQPRLYKHLYQKMQLSLAQSTSGGLTPDFDMDDFALAYMVGIIHLDPPFRIRNAIFRATLESFIKAVPPTSLDQKEEGEIKSILNLIISKYATTIAEGKGVVIGDESQVSQDIQ